MNDISRKIVSVMILTMSIITITIVNANEVWSENYESYISTDFVQSTICEQNVTYDGADIDGMVWSEIYEEYIEAKNVEHVIHLTEKTALNGAEEVYSEIYEEFVSPDLGEYVLGTEALCKHV